MIPDSYCGLPLTVKANPRAKRVLVKLVPGRGLEVVTPKRFPKRDIPSILDEKRTWIERTSARMMADGTDLSGTPPEMPDTVVFPAAEREYTVHTLSRPGRVTVTENGSRLLVRGPGGDRPSLIEGLCRFTVRKAREVLLPRLDTMSRQLNMPYEALRVRRQKTRWGSCSARGTISLNAKLLFLSPQLVDHLLLHELCHTRHLNHSKRFWALVASHQPDYVRLENALKRGNRHVPNWFL